MMKRFYSFLQRAGHREHGNRIMHEFLLGQENIQRDLPARGKTYEYKQATKR